MVLALLAAALLAVPAGTAASGILSNTVNVSYPQPIGSTERLASGSVYSLTWTVSAT
jgi:hypothetical protein